MYALIEYRNVNSKFYPKRVVPFPNSSIVGGNLHKVYHIEDVSRSEVINQFLAFSTNALLNLPWFVILKRKTNWVDEELDKQ